MIFQTHLTRRTIINRYQHENMKGEIEHAIHEQVMDYSTWLLRKQLTGWIQGVLIIFQTAGCCMLLSFPILDVIAWKEKFCILVIYRGTWNGWFMVHFRMIHSSLPERPKYLYSLRDILLLAISIESCFSNKFSYLIFRSWIRIWNFSKHAKCILHFTEILF